MTNPWPDEVDTFVTTARNFVDLCERTDDHLRPKEMRAKCLLRLSELYVAALNLPDLPFRDAPEPPRSNDDQPRVMKNLNTLPFQYYCKPLDPIDIDKGGNMAVGDLFDDFVDIHGDLSDGLWLVDNGHWEAAVWHWRLLYWHWSNHLIGALYALHIHQSSDLIGSGPQYIE